MRDNLTKMVAIMSVLLLTGCTQQDTTTQTGVLITNELSSEQMQPGGSVLLRTSLNNYFDNELQNTQAKLIRSFGQLSADTTAQEVGIVQANPNATSRASWTINVKSTASSGSTYTNKVRVCFTYNQTAWHELALVNSFEIESQINKGSDTGPMQISFAGLDTEYLYNENVQSQIPISVSIKNNYIGYVGKIDLSRDVIPNLTYIEMRIYDEGGGSFDPGNVSPGTNLWVDDTLTNPSCSGDQTTGCFVCDNSQWVEEEELYRCYAKDLQVFGEEVFIGTKLKIAQLNSEELIETIEVMASYDYCIESEEFTLTVFQPGA